MKGRDVRSMLEVVMFSPREPGERWNEGVPLDREVKREESRRETLRIARLERWFGEGKGKGKGERTAAGWRRERASSGRHFVRLGL